jgi:hypothetical protein
VAGSRQKHARFALRALCDRTAIFCFSALLISHVHGKCRERLTQGTRRAENGSSVVLFRAPCRVGEGWSCGFRQNSANRPHALRLNSEIFSLHLDFF